MHCSSPYQKSTFKDIWLKHFHPNATLLQQEGFTNLDFVGTKGPMYHNLGGTNTKGIRYGTDPESLQKTIKGRVLVIYDVPDQGDGETTTSPGAGRLRIPQYPGYLCELQGTTSAEEYMGRQLGKRTRTTLRNYGNRLDRDHDIRFQMIKGEIEEETYNRLFNRFHELLTKRFEDKKTVNNNLDPQEWDFYQEVSLPMLRKGEAGLFVTFDRDTPVAMTLLNFSEDRAYDVIRVFDIAYSKYRLGTLSLIQQLDWCIRNNFKYMDFSKGEYEYKKQWGNVAYMFHYHLWYDRRSLKCTLLAHGLAFKFLIKYWARKYRLQDAYHKWRYKLKNKTH